MARVEGPGQGVGDGLRLADGVQDLVSGFIHQMDC